MTFMTLNLILTFLWPLFKNHGTYEITKTIY